MLCNKSVLCLCKQSMVKGITNPSAHAIYRHLERYCTHPSNYRLMAAFATLQADLFSKRVCVCVKDESILTQNSVGYQ